MVSLLSLGFWLCSQDMKIFLIIPHHHQVSHQTKSFQSTPLSLPTGWIFISYQYKPIKSMKISTHSSKLTILASASAADLAGNQLHMHNPVSCMHTTQQVGLSTNSTFNYSHCFERWVGPDYLLLFPASVDVFVLSCRVQLLRFIPFWSDQILAQDSLTTSGHIWALTYSTLNSHSMNMFNRSFNQLRIHWSHSLPFNNLKQI